MGELAYLTVRHPLVGRWQGEHGLVEYDVEPAGRGFRVRARLHLEGIELPVRRVHWDGSTLSFATRMPDSGACVLHRLSVHADGSVRHHFRGLQTWTRRPADEDREEDGE